MRHLGPENYTVSTWAGGKTVQLAIGPADQKYADRTFLWRVSSASVELESSEFTALPDYERLIAPIRGEMALSHNGGEETVLKPFEIHWFDGADRTCSRGRCTDFNLMLRKGKAEGKMQAIILEKGESALLPADELGDTSIFFLAEGRARAVLGGSAAELSEGESILLPAGDGSAGNGAAEGLQLFDAGEDRCVFMAALIWH